jgi:transposase
MTRGRVQLVRDRCRLQNQVEALLEEARIKLSCAVSDLLGVSARRILKSLSEGMTDPAQLAQLLDEQMEKLSRMAAESLKPHQAAVLRVAKMPGWGAESAQQIVAEVGVDAEAFETPEALASWAGVCPGSNVSAEENHSSRCLKGNRYVRRLLTEAAQAAVKKNGSQFQNVLRRFWPKLGHNGAIGVVRHRMARVL